MLKKKEFLSQVLTLLNPSGNVTSRTMFGGYGVYKNGVITALIAYDTLFFKVGKDNQSDFEKAGSKPFTYDGRKDKKIVMSYWQVPTFIMKDQKELIRWFEKAYVVSLASKKNKKRIRAS